MIDDIGCSLESAHFADTSHIAPIPFNPELEILVWIESLRINTELRHYHASLCLQLSGYLAELDHHKFSRFEWSKTNQYIDDTPVDIVLCRGFLIAFDEIRLP